MNDKIYIAENLEIIYIFFLSKSKTWILILIVS